VDFLLVSDASAPIADNPSRLKAAFRLINIATDQVRGLRARMLVSHFEQNPGSGSYLRMGNSQPYIFNKAKVAPPTGWNLSDSMTKDEVSAVESFDTTLRKLTKTEFRRLFRHGYEVADATLFAHNPTMFPYCGTAP
jgi:NTE family protein